MTPRRLTPLACAAGLLALATGCSQPPPACVDEGPDDCRVDSVTVDGKERRYVVSRRGALDCAQGRVPLVFAWHGATANGGELRGYLGLEEEVGHGALFVYPDGLPRPDTLGETGWNRDPDGDDLRFFDRMREALVQDDCVDASRVFSIGHSRGGRFVEVLACHRADTHRAFASIAAGTDGASACPGRAPMWLSHGEGDRTIPYTQGLANRDRWAARNGCSTEIIFPLDVCTELPGCAPGLPVVWCPSSVSQWGGHAPAPFTPVEVKQFFSRFW